MVALGDIDRSELVLASFDALQCRLTIASCWCGGISATRPLQALVLQFSTKFERFPTYQLPVSQMICLQLFKFQLPRPRESKRRDIHKKSLHSWYIYLPSARVAGSSIERKSRRMSSPTSGECTVPMPTCASPCRSRIWSSDLLMLINQFLFDSPR